MILGIPRERKTLEKRVAVSPDGALELAKRGHEVLIETNAGAGSGYADAEYDRAGCKVVDTLKEVWQKAELIVKVKEPHDAEYEYFRPGLVVFDFLHLAGLPELAKALVKHKVTSIAYELIQTKDMRLPLLEPMSEIAGKLAVMNGASLLLAQHGGSGILLGGSIGTLPAAVVILGAGAAGSMACEIAIGMGADVTVLDIDYRKLEQLRARFGSRVKTLHSTRSNISEQCQRADLLIGAVLVPGASTPCIVSREMISSMKKNSVFVDLSVDQGGCAETTETTSLANPTFDVDGITHYCVPNLAAQVPLTSTRALTAVTLPYILTIADTGVTTALKSFKEIRNALNTHNGMLTNKAVSDAVGIKYTTIEEALLS